MALMSSCAVLIPSSDSCTDFSKSKSKRSPWLVNFDAVAYAQDARLAPEPRLIPSLAQLLLEQ